VAWTVRNASTDAVLQAGTAVAEADRLVAVTGITVPKDPQRVRLELRVGGAPRPGDVDADGAIDLDDVALLRAAPADLDGDGQASAADADLLERFVLRYGCPADLDGDRVVNGNDLGRLLAAWGPCPAGCAADIVRDGAVDGIDLGALLGAWGPCR
jgi:hypothetical protein